MEVRKTMVILSHNYHPVKYNPDFKGVQLSRSTSVNAFLVQ